MDRIPLFERAARQQKRRQEAPALKKIKIEKVEKKKKAKEEEKGKMRYQRNVQIDGRVGLEK